VLRSIARKVAVLFMCGLLFFNKIDPATAILGSHNESFVPFDSAIVIRNA